MDHTADKQVDVRLEGRLDGLVAFVIIDNPKKLNSMNSDLMAQFVAIMGELAANDALRAVVLTGAGDKAFIGGADIKERVRSAIRTAAAPSSPRCMPAATRSAPFPYR
jgi:enoyl-CoA hydratase